MEKLYFIFSGKKNVKDRLDTKQVDVLQGNFF